MAKETYKSPEYDVQADNYLNLYHGVDNLDPSKISHYANLSEDEKTTFETFVKQVQAHDFESDVGNDHYIDPDEMTMLRFLQSDNYDTAKALKRLVATLKWHQEVKLGPVISTPPEKLATYRKIRVRACMGRTKDGMPIFVERLAGFMNGIPSPAGKTLTDEDWIQCFLYDLGELLQQIRESYTKAQEESNPVTWKATWIMDCRGLSVYRAMKAMKTIKMIDSLTEPNFPEFAGPIYMINAPSLVAGIWKISKAFLDPAVVAKIQIHSNVPKDIMMERIDESVLFEEYGGTNKKDFPKSEYI